MGPAQIKEEINEISKIQRKKKIPPGFEKKIKKVSTQSKSPKAKLKSPKNIKKPITIVKKKIVKQQKPGFAKIISKPIVTAGGNIWDKKKEEQREIIKAKKLEAEKRARIEAEKRKKEAEKRRREKREL